MRGAATGTERSSPIDAAVRKRSVVVAGHRTSISLEEEFWAALREVAARRRVSINALVAGIDVGRQPGQPGNLSSALRVFILDCYRRGELPLERAVTAPGS
jgi:predicted DNA-binding ribbon-helix-helix protein